MSTSDLNYSILTAYTILLNEHERMLKNALKVSKLLGEGQCEKNFIEVLREDIEKLKEDIKTIKELGL